MAGTIYYDDVTGTQLDRFEEGFFDGFSDEVEKILESEDKI